jgi:hypothetical protein
MIDHNPCHGWELIFEPQGWRSTPLSLSHPICCGKDVMRILFILFHLKNYTILDSSQFGPCHFD